jgi:hypothetical protein
MNENKYRIGRFTSSGISALMKLAKDGKSFGKPALTYIEEKNMERKLGRSLTSESNARPTTWGQLVEKRAFELLGTEYRLCSSETIEHPTLPEYWAGSPDLIKFDEGQTVVDIKCPYTLKSFCQFADCKTIEDIRDKHPDGEDYYWQLISNAILTNSKYAELIIYCPYKSELEEIRDLAANVDGASQNRFAWVGFAEDKELPYLLDGGYYENLNIIRFEVSEDDKNLLTAIVENASKLLL